MTIRAPARHRARHRAAGWLMVASLVVLALFPAAGTALGHTPKVTLTCEQGLVVKLTAYDSSKGPINTVAVEIDGVAVPGSPFSFGASFNTTWVVEPATEPHTATVVISAWDDPSGSRGFSRTYDLELDGCVEPTPTPTPTPDPTPTPEPEAADVTIWKYVCPSYGDVPANQNPSNQDATGGRWAELDSSYQTVMVDPATDVPEACEPASGWSFELRRGNGGSLIDTAVTGADGSATVEISGDDVARLGAGSWSGGVIVTEVVEPEHGFGALRCYTDILNGDNLESIYGWNGDDALTCIAYNVAETPEPTPTPTPEPTPTPTPEPTPTPAPGEALLVVLKALDLDGDIETTDDWVDGEGWTFDVSAANGTVDPGQGVTDADGVALFDVVPGTEGATLAVTESYDPEEYAFLDAACFALTEIDEGIEPRSLADELGDEARGTVGDGTVTGVPIASGETVVCLFVNASGDVAEETATPRITPPPTDTLPATGTPGGDSWRIALLAIAGLLGTMLLLTPTTAKARRRR